jgi:hypothetical protein
MQMLMVRDQHNQEWVIMSYEVTDCLAAYLRKCLMISQSLSSPLLNLELFSIMGWLSKGKVISSKVLENNMAQLNKVTV